MNNRGGVPDSECFYSSGARRLGLWFLGLSSKLMGAAVTRKI